MTSYTWLAPLRAECTRRPTWDGIVPLSTSLAYFCPGCGNIWARLYATGKEWHCLTIPCPTCPQQWPWRPAGSLLLSWNPHSFDELPLPLATREFLLHYDHYQRTHPEWNPTSTSSTVPSSPNDSSGSQPQPSPSSMPLSASLGRQENCSTA